MPQQISRSESFRLTPDSTWALFNPPKWARTLERTSSIECVSHELLALIIKPMSSSRGDERRECRGEGVEPFCLVAPGEEVRS